MFCNRPTRPPSPPRSRMEHFRSLKRGRDSSATEEFGTPAKKEAKKAAPSNAPQPPSPDAPPPPPSALLRHPLQGPCVAVELVVKARTQAAPLPARRGRLNAAAPRLTRAPPARLRPRHRPQRPGLGAHVRLGGLGAAAGAGGWWRPAARPAPGAGGQRRVGRRGAAIGGQARPRAGEWGRGGVGQGPDGRFPPRQATGR